MRQLEGYRTRPKAALRDVTDFRKLMRRHFRILKAQKLRADGFVKTKRERGMKEYWKK